LIATLMTLNLTALLLEETPPSHPGWRIINLLVFAIVLIYIFQSKLKIGQIFDRRASSIAKELEESRREKLEAEERLGRIDARLAGLDKEIAGLKAQAELEAKREAERIRQAAAADAEKIQQLARREIDGALKAARSELRAFVADHSVTMAEGIIRKGIRPDDNNRLLSRYVDDLGEVNK
jgi:F-type H+-transporting ATPase subunit b